MNNKRLGTIFEQRVVKCLTEGGWWVHFITPNAAGQQPFDIIAVKHGKALAIDCKTCADDVFRFDRLEENQKFAFERWLKCGNHEPYLIVEHNCKMYCIPYTILRDNRVVLLKDDLKWGLDARWK